MLMITNVSTRRLSYDSLRLRTNGPRRGWAPGLCAWICRPLHSAWVEGNWGVGWRCALLGWRFRFFAAARSTFYSMAEAFLESIEHVFASWVACGGRGWSFV